MKIPYIKQKNDWFCGPACANMILASAGFSYTQDQVARMLKTSPYHGTNRQPLVNLFRKHHFQVERKAYASIADLRRALSQGFAIIVNYIEPTDDIGHFAVVVRITKAQVIMHDPWNGPYFKLPIREFLPRWHGMHTYAYKHWMLAVKP